MDNLEQALSFIKVGRLDEARTYLEELIKQSPDDIRILYNLGVLYSEMGEPTKAAGLLERAVSISPEDSRTQSGLGHAYLMLGDLARAKEASLKAAEMDPSIPQSMRNLGAIFGHEGDLTKSLYYLKKAHELDPGDPQTVYGLALAYRGLDDFETANRYLRILMEMQAPSSLKRMARELQRETAVGELKAGEKRMDTVFHLLKALRLFQTMSLHEVQAVTFEIGLMGRLGLDLNDSSARYTLNSISGEYSGLELACLMYAGFKQIDPGFETGLGLEEEYEMALKLAMSNDMI